MDTMREIRAKFIGEDGSLGYRKGEVYRLVIDGNKIREPRPCPYSSVEAFLANWEPVEETPGGSDA